MKFIPHGYVDHEHVFLKFFSTYTQTEYFFA
jgi:hypothetical protein